MGFLRMHKTFAMFSIDGSLMLQWERRRNVYGFRTVSELQLVCHFPPTAYPYYCSNEGAIYQKRLEKMLPALSVVRRLTAPSFWTMWTPFTNCLCWLLEMHFELNMCSTGFLVLLGLRNVIAFEIQHQECGDFYDSRPALWLPHNCCRLLPGPSPPIFAYYSIDTLDYKGSPLDSGIWKLWSISFWSSWAFSWSPGIVPSVTRVSILVFSCCLLVCLSFTGEFAWSYSRLLALSSHRQLCVRLCFSICGVFTLDRDRLEEMWLWWTLVY